MNRRTLAAVFASVLLAAPANPATAQTPPVAGPIELRRVYVPAEVGVDRWPLRNERYLPVEPDEFERLLREAQAAGAVVEPPPQTAVAELELTGRWDGAALLAGTGKMSLRLPNAAALSVPLDAPSWSIVDPQWVADGTSAILGVDARGKTSLFADRSGDVAFAWSQNVVPDATGISTAVLRLPPAAVVRLIVEVREGTDVTIDGAVAEAPVASASGFRRRTFLASGGIARLRFLGGRSGAATPPQAAVRQSSYYELSDRGAELTAELRIDALPTPLDKLDVELDPGLTLVDVSAVDRRAVWTVPTGPRRVVTIAFDRPLLGTARTVLLRAVGPLAIGVRSRLPVVRALGLFWQQGTLTVAVPTPLHVDRLDVRSGAASTPVPLTGTRAGQAFEVQCFDAGAYAEIVVSRRSEPIRQTGVTTVRLSPRDATAEYRSRVQAIAGEFFSLEAYVPARWIVDSVSTVPPTALNDWSLSELRDKRRLLTLRLAQALTPERPLQLVIAAHAKHGGADRALQRDDLRVAEFVGARDDAPTAAVAGDASLRLHVERDEDSAPAAEDALDPVRRELLGDFAFEHLLDLGDAATWRLRTRRRLPHYDARLHVAAYLEADELTEHYRLEIKNREPLPIERLLVRFRPAKSAPLRWTIGEETRGRLEARRLPPEAPDSDAELWQIVFNRPVAGDLELHARRTTPVGAATEVSLPMVAEAVDQQGTLLVAAGAASGAQLRTRSLTPLPAPFDRTERRLPIRGMFQFDPIRTTESVPPALVLSKSAEAATAPRAVVWRLHSTADVQSDGSVRHRAILDVQTFDDGSCRIDFPEDATEGVVEIDGLRRTPAADRRVVVPFPERRRLFSLLVGFTTRRQEAAAVRMVALPRFEIDLPILYDERRLRIPSAYDAPVDVGFKSLAESGALHGLRRLAGPLASPTAPTLDFSKFESVRSRLDGAATTNDVIALRQVLGAVLHGPDAGAVWSVLWGQVGARRASDAPPLFFDGESLRTAGLGPQARVASFAPAATSDRDAGEQLLAASGIHLFTKGRSIIVSAQPRQDDHDAVRVFPSLDAWEPAARDEDFVDYETWRRENPPLWDHATEHASTLDHRPESEGVPMRSSTAGVWVVRRETPTSLAVALVLAAFAVGRLSLPQRRTAWGVGVVAAAVTALTLPLWLSVAATSALLGLLFAGAAEVALPRRRRVRTSGLGVGSATGEPFGNLPVRPTLAKALVGWALLATAGAEAAENGPPLLVERPATFEVLIPVGPDRKPTKDRYQVPESLLRFFERRTSQSSAGEAAPTVWKRAEYFATLARDTEQKRFVVTELKGVFEGHAFASPAAVVIPLEIGAAIPIGSALLDGRLIEVERTKAGLRFAAAASGPFRFEIDFRPPTTVDGGRSGWNLGVPPIHDVRLHLALPVGLTGLQVASAAEAPRLGDDQRSATVRLLPTSRLAVSWSDEPLPPGTSGVVEQLTWLKVRPGSTVVDARFRVRTARPLRELVLRSDPRLQWLPKRSDRSAVTDVRSSPIVVDQATVAEQLTVQLAKPIVDEGVVDVSFLMTGVRGVGRIRIPELRPEEGQAVRRCFAYSVDPLLEASVTGGAGLAPVAVPEFMRRWDVGEAALPQAAYDLTAEDSDWTLAVRPTAERIEANLLQTVVCGRRRIDVLWEAETTVRRGSVTRYELRVPAALQIETVTATEIGGDGGDQALEWSRDDRGEVVVLLRAAAGGGHKLTLRGVATPDGGGGAPLPLVGLRCDSVRAHRIRLLRKFDTLLHIARPHDLTLQPESATDEANAAANRVSAEYAVAGPAPAALLQMTPNAAEFTAQCVTTLTADDSRWDCEFNAALNVTAGVLDEIEIRLPAEVATPLAVTPTMPYEVSAGETEGRRVVLRPRAPLTGAFQFSVRARLEERRNEAAVPFIRLQHGPGGEYFVRLPAAVGLHPVRWETDQLAPAGAPLPAAAAARNREFVVLRVVGPKPKALLRPVTGVSGRPFIRFADHRLALDDDGGYFGVSTFLVEPSGLKSLTLRVPDGVEILQTLDGDALVTPFAGDDALRRLTLLSDRMPQFVDVVYRTRRSTASDVAVEIAVPKPEEVPIERTLWTIAEPSRSRLEPNSAVAVSRFRTEVQRLEMLDASLTDLRSQGTLESAAPWSVPLLRRRDRVRNELLRLAGRHDDAERRDAQRLLDDSDRNTGAWRVEETAALGEHRDGAQADVDELWNSTVSPYASVVCLATADGRCETSVRRADPGTETSRKLAAIVGGLLLLAAGRLWTSADGGARWGQVVGMLAGIAWIVWLRPAFVGWVLLAVVLACRLHPSLRRARRRPPTLTRSLSVLR